MAYDRLDDETMPGYFLPEESQFRLAKLRDHVRFLVRLAQPRT
ncbi:XAC0095 family protein, partial [Xanthomonas translucens]